MSVEGDLIQNEIDEDLIYLEMYEAILEELHVDEDSGEETPELDSLGFTKEQISQIRKGGIQVFKEILQKRVRESTEQEQNENEYNQQITSIDQQDNHNQQENGKIIKQQTENSLEQQIEIQKSPNSQLDGTKTNQIIDAQDNAENQKEDILQRSKNQKEIELQKTLEEAQQQQEEILKQTLQRDEQIAQESAVQKDINLKEELTNQAQGFIQQQDQNSHYSETVDQSQQNQQEQFLDIKINNEDTQRNNENQINQPEKKVNNPKDIQNNQINHDQYQQEENYDSCQFQNEKQAFNDQNYQSLKIDYETISPICKRDQYREQQFVQSYNQQSLSAKNSSGGNEQFSNSSNKFNSAQNSNEKNKSSKANKIINDIFSLSGIKVGQYKSITPMGYSSVNLSTSNVNNRKDYNQSALTQYQYASTSSTKNTDKEDYVTRLYRKQEEIEEKIRQMQEDKLKKEQEKYKIEIAKGSQKILQKTFYRKPSDISTTLYKDQIEKRQQLLEEKKKEKIESEIKNCTFYPQTLQKSNINKIDGKSVNQFYDEQQKWKQNKTQTIVQGQLEQIKKELEGATFHPKINKQSQSIIRDIKVEEKLIQDKEKFLEKQKKLSESSQPLFKPVILPKSQELAKKRKEKEFVPTFEVSSKYN
ncbi:hypothetical protein TTHERM_00684470 (macronuclear) [Tetrahymena thermophila SB210]|uniref:Uncharacterized protein n=1 Tax=Tetrahymena thermophila (strain SB210) TaxID=312017 RepID=I7LXL9_TETTS|nr:hypothetical protein TTHERM_00684470 [Tetrahymena thermophila SB210]EAS04903.1 hypothetical protein TTHERM_00684470 [Tetrahymena thermophila SB210]|eukprot:XP_001025148.1 hypothetical protein TTHERM_00684470 [Tetrahymena thermophila SB210]